jgi:hypothetical protein
MSMIVRRISTALALDAVEPLQASAFVFLGALDSPAVDVF